MRKEFNYLQFKNKKLDSDTATNIYNELISYCQSDDIDGYTEIHHILPKSLGGTNEKENLVKLTFPEHIFAHYLLSIVHFPNYAMLKAFIFMSCSNQDLNNIKCEEDILVNFSEFENYALLREQNSINQSKKHLSSHTKYTVIINDKKFTDLYKNDLPRLFENNNLTTVVYKNKPIQTKTICYRPSYYANNNIIRLTTINFLYSYKLPSKIDTLAENDDIANIISSNKTKKKYVFLLNETIHVFTRKEFSEYLENNNVKAIENCKTGRVLNNIKQILNHIDRFIENGIIRFNIY